MALIAPHGADELRPLIVDDKRRAELEAEALTLPSLMVSSAAAANAVMMGTGQNRPSVVRSLSATESASARFI